jgi:ankyrin repeat protein
MDFDINARIEFANAPKYETGKVHQSTPFLLAVAPGVLPLLVRLIGHARFDAVLSGVRRGLFIATKSLNLGVFELLEGILANSLTCRNKRGESILTYACLSGAQAIVRHILEGLDNVSVIDLQFALAASLRVDNGTCFGLIAEKMGAGVNLVWPVGINGHRHQIDEDESDREDREEPDLPEIPEGVPAIIAAARLSRRHIIEQLLGLSGVDVNARGEHGQTVLFELSGNLSQLAGDVIRCGCFIDRQDDAGNTALMHAIMKRETLLVGVLVQLGIGLRVKNMYGQTAWDLVQVVGRLRMAEPPEDDELLGKRIVDLMKLAPVPEPESYPSPDYDD